MAGSLNRVQLIGHLGAAPEIRTGPTGTRIANMRIATSETWKDKDTGEKKERTDWHTVVVFADGLAEVCQKYLNKGSKVYAEGQLQTRKWTDQQNVDRYSTEVVIRPYSGSIILLDRVDNRPPPADEGAYGSARPATGGGAAAIDDDIPFYPEVR